MSKVTGLTTKTEKGKDTIKGSKGMEAESELKPPQPRNYRGMGHSITNYRKTAALSTRKVRNRKLDVSDKPPGRRR